MNIVERTRKLGMIISETNDYYSIGNDRFWKDETFRSIDKWVLKNYVNELQLQLLRVALESDNSFREYSGSDSGVAKVGPFLGYTAIFLGNQTARLEAKKHRLEELKPIYKAKAIDAGFDEKLVEDAIECATIYEHETPAV